MRTALKVALVIVAVIATPITLFAGTVWWETWKPSHYLDPVTRFIRTNAARGEYVKLAPGLLGFGESRDIVEERLKGSSFHPAKGTPFAAPTSSPYELWFRRNQFLALWHFNVRLTFDEDRLVSADGRFAGPTFK